MKISRIAGLAALAVLAIGQARAEVVGGELRLGHERFLDDVVVGGREEVLSRTALEGALELEFGYSGAGLQVDLGLDRAGLLDGTGINATVHGLYALPVDATVGVFLGRDGFDDVDSIHYGIEGFYEYDRFSGQGYVMGVTDDADGTVVGLRGDMLLSAQLSVGARIDYADLDGGADAARYGLTAKYDVTPSTSVSAELGIAEASVQGIGSADEAYVGVQATVGFGTGATFDRRGLLDLLPGF